MLWSSLNPTAPYKRFTRDAPDQEFRLAGIEDLHGNAWHCVYTNGRLQSLQSTWGEGLDFSYQNDGLLTAISRYTFTSTEEGIAITPGKLRSRAVLDGPWWDGTQCASGRADVRPLTHAINHRFLRVWRMKKNVTI